MKSKRQKIVEAAWKLFSEKGFKTASIQAVANECGISKGAVYLHFRSKKDLLMTVMETIDREIKDHIEEIRASPGLSPRARLREQIIYQFKDIIQNQSLIETFIRDSGLNVDEPMLLYIQKVRYEWQKIQEDFLSDVYGSQIDHFLIDLAVILNGVINEYYTLLIVESLSFDINRVADFLVEVTDHLVKGLLADRAMPILTREMMPNRAALEAKINKAAYDNVRTALLELEKEIKAAKLAVSERTELRTVLDVLHAEMNKNDPNKILIQGMLANFRGYKELTPIRKRIAAELKIKLL